MRRIIPCIAVTANRRLLLLQRGFESKYPHQWCIPGGKIEEGETPEQCAVRELREETGIELADGTQLRLLGDFDSSAKDDAGAPFCLRVYTVDFGIRPIVRIEDGFEGFGWFSVNDSIFLGAMQPATVVGKQVGAEAGQVLSPLQWLDSLINDDGEYEGYGALTHSTVAALIHGYMTGDKRERS